MPSRLARLIFASLLATGLACDDNKPGGGNNVADGGSGGSTPSGAGGSAVAGTGGTTSSPDAATGTDTGTPGATCNIPCLADIGKDCIPMGACVEQTVNLVPNRCYANGVKILNQLNVALPPAPSTMIVTYKKGNAVCYTIEMTATSLTPSQATGAATWKNAAGMTVATGTYDFGTMKATVMCGNQSFEPNPSCAAAMNLPSIPGAQAPASTCTPGTCN